MTAGQGALYSPIVTGTAIGALIVRRTLGPAAAILVLLAGLALAPAGAVRAEPLLADQDRAAIQGVILAQMEAFGRDDAPGAFAFAAPAIRERFATPADFLSMVREAYAPVYRPRQVAFGEVFFVGDRPVQRLLVTAPNERIVVADYLMEREADGQWRIAAVYLSDTGQTPI